MPLPKTFRLLLFLALGLLAGGAASYTGPTFSQRVEAQRAIERAYYSHQVGATQEFDVAVPLTLLEDKVRTYLRQTVALEQLWATPITAEMLHAEAERMARGSRMPDRLRELYQALNNDSAMILECLVRPALVDRLARSHFEADTFRSKGSTWDGWWKSVEATLDESQAGAPRPSGAKLPALEPTATPWEPPPAGSAAPLTTACVNGWFNGSLDDPYLAEAREGHTAVWTGSIMIVWGGREALTSQTANTGFRYDPATDMYKAVSTTGAPEARNGHTAVWGNGRMIIWGGQNSLGENLNTGAEYRPDLDSWMPLPVSGAPSARTYHTAVWAPPYMIVWGGGSGANLFKTGAKYHQLSQTWTPISLAGAPSARLDHSAVTDGNMMIVWGGYDGLGAGVTQTGASYSISGDAWVPTSTINAPSARRWHRAVWTATDMIIWGGYDNQGPLQTGAKYNFSSGSWTPLPTSGAPAARYHYTAVWDGTEMILWGVNGFSFGPGTGGRYNPASNSWSPMSVAGAPEPGSQHTAVWTGTLMLVWGGNSYAKASLDGGKYDPLTDTWVTTPNSDARPIGKTFSGAVWTGSLMIMWGGYSELGLERTGARYDPAIDKWTPTTTVGAPPESSTHVAVWTGSRMIVWNGSSGGRYDPVADSWLPVSTVNAAPGGAAVWTGSEMVTWSGGGGGRYNPTTDSWRPVSTNGAPVNGVPTVVWTGQWMIAWGGSDDSLGYPAYPSTGGRYDPVADTWSPTSLIDAPTGRAGHVAVWTGNRMIVWGGWVDDYGYFSGAGSGGRYDPVADTWQPMVANPNLNFYLYPAGNSAVWTGSRMLIWGGRYYSGPCCNWVFSNNGALYDPDTDSWTPVTTSGAPQPRADHRAVWTGQSMLLWGGYCGSGCKWDNTGGLFRIDSSLDGDRDGFDSACDCNDADPIAWSPPSEAQNLTIKQSPQEQEIAWDSPGIPGSSVVIYDVLRSSLAPNFESGTSCVISDTMQRSITDASPSSPGEVWYYLIRSQNACPPPNQSLGTDSGGTPRIGRDCP